MYATAACEREKKGHLAKKSWALEMHALIVGIEKMGFKKKISACFKPVFFVSVLNVLFQKKKREKQEWMELGREKGEKDVWEER